MREPTRVKVLRFLGYGGSTVATEATTGLERFLADEVNSLIAITQSSYRELHSSQDVLIYTLIYTPRQP